MAKFKGEDADQNLFLTRMMTSITEEQKKKISELANESRAQYAHFKKFGWLIFPVGFLIGILMFIFSEGHNFMILVAASMVTIFLGIGAYAGARANALKKFQNDVVPGLIKLVYGDDASYVPSQGWARQFLENLNLFEFGNIYKTDGQINGSYKDVRFSVANVVSGNQTTDSKGHSSTVYYFNGLIAVYQFNKEFPGSLEIREEENGAGWSRNFAHSTRIDFEDVVFNKQFNVYANDKEAAFYVITPQFIEAFKEIKARVPGTLIFCIQSDRLIIAINGAKNRFDYALSIKDNEELIKKLVSEILPFQWFVEMFNLDDSFGKKAVEKAYQEAAKAAALREQAGDDVASQVENKIEGESEKISGLDSASAEQAVTAMATTSSKDVVQKAGEEIESVADK
ncbi:MAG: DUF3137 domain-containing protein [Bacilli bacterium]|jgi:hypothetical protein|nr:DUF3137 domain-containing protein [Bacilli bacterium]